MASPKNNSFRSRLYERQLDHGIDVTAEKPRGGCEGFQDRALEIGKAVRVYDVVEPPAEAMQDSRPEPLW